jgi:hypothetical protein
MTRYRFGERVRRRKLIFRHARVGIVGVVLIFGTEIGMTQMAPSNITRVLQLGTSPAPTNLNNMSSTSPQRIGSSGPPPKGVVAAISTTSPLYTQLRKASSCGPVTASHPSLSSSPIAQLRKLAQYEQLCGGSITQRSSFFVPTPSTPSEAQTDAEDAAETLKAFASAKVAPLVFMEPNDVNGNNLDLNQYANGAYDNILTSYFAALKANGITSAMMGMWVYVPEGNLPLWSTSDPNIFAAVVTKTAQFQKQAFPGSQTSIMLDSQSFAAGTTWGAGTYVSLMPYVQNIPGGLIDSFGLQGFPWAAPANQPDQELLYNPATYLRADFAIEAAQHLGIKNVWFNTGTFGEKYSNQGAATVTVDPIKRQQMLDSVIQAAKTTQGKGIAVSIHLFAENKSDTAEATDWSYWHTTLNDKTDTTVLVTFVHDAASAGIPLWLYDS